MDFKGIRGEFFEKMKLAPFWNLKNSPFWGWEKSSEKPQNAPPFGTVRVFWRLFVGKSKILFIFFCEISFRFTRSHHSLSSGAGAQEGPSGSPYLESRFGVAQFHHSNILDLQSYFFMLFYSYWQNKVHYCIILTFNLLTWRKVSPVFYWKTEPFIPTYYNSKKWEF